VAFDNTTSNLFVSASNPPTDTGVIYKINSAGVESAFAVGLSPFAPMACDSAGNLLFRTSAATSINLPRAECGAPLPPD